jgi:hypothetical protein
MSDGFAKRQPLIDFDESEGHLCSPRFTDQKAGDLLAELRRIIGDKDEPYKTDFEPKTRLSAKARQDAAEPGEWKQPEAATLPGAERSMVEDTRPNSPGPLISGDFAAIEAGLLGVLQEHTTTVSKSDASNVFPSLNLGSEHRLYQESQPDPRHGFLAEGKKRSRRSLRVIVAIAFVGMAGTAVIFGLNRSEPEIALIKADNGPGQQQMEATSSAGVPAQDAPIHSKPPEPSPMALVKGNERTFDLPQAEEKTPPIDSNALLDNGPTAVPVVPVQAPTPAEPLSTAAPVEPNTAKTDLVPSDGTLLPSGRPPQANINGVPLPAPPPAAKAPTAKAAGRVAKQLKPAMAKHPGSHGQPRQIANKAKATPVSPLTSEPAPIANPKAETSTTQPSPVTNGAFGFVQSAMNSLTGATAKLFEWGLSGSRP